ncbi:hypothetical protein FOA52_004951 [Chlamydomonas sp. UWO 241]|nr:hypothetical protein FOA52_004951 [Chlamydomonas sp. UWO 241]
MMMRWWLGARLLVAGLMLDVVYAQMQGPRDGGPPYDGPPRDGLQDGDGPPPLPPLEKVDVNLGRLKITQEEDGGTRVKVGCMVETVTNPDQGTAEVRVGPNGGVYRQKTTDGNTDIRVGR